MDNPGETPPVTREEVGVKVTAGKNRRSGIR